MKNVAIYRTVMPIVSESFIIEQARSLIKYSPIYVCRDLNSPIAADSLSIDSNSKLSRVKYTLCRTSNTFVRGLGKKKLSLIHAHFLPDAVMIMPTAKKLGLPLIATSHGFDTQMSRWSQFKTLRPTNVQFLLHEQYLYKNADAFIAVSNFMRNKMIARGIPSDKIFTHYIGIDTKKFAPSKQQSKFILNVSRHVSWKGVEVLLKAFAQVPASLGWKLLQVGAGYETIMLKKLATELAVDDRVEWLGAQPHDVVQRLMQECSCYVQASLPDKNGQTEAFGMVLLEAAASGVPVLVSRSGGMPEGVIDNETGYLFEPGNFNELAEKLNYVLAQSNEWRKTMGLAGRAFAQSLDIRSQTLLLENIYDQVIANHASN
ncbi:glycosyltransferase [Iodobacter fluviatilis]|uniref:Glycosyl transferase family 1 n=1 Tax=Iodobacter fluviatilis TaxID=537 RepID=A0A7G3GBI8_9NEIS|nr:glycosyltransferase [Iodobacter fluviatilis]QBC44085.1 glycosyl transferase family 1 [Iodobacter fluviatilis]